MLSTMQLQLIIAYISIFLDINQIAMETILLNL